jgi:AmmeMemoRadiSam system protein B
MKHMLRQLVLIVLFFVGILPGNSVQGQHSPGNMTRGLADTVGFAHLDWQMDSVVSRIEVLNQADLTGSHQEAGTLWRTAICPHDDYTYAGWLYPAVLRNIKASTVIIFGVAHKAGLFNLENQLVFDSFQSWHGPYGAVKVSPLRDEIISQLPGDMAVVHDSMEAVEHSVEALIPFLQNQDRNIEIISILVPYMDFQRMQRISQELARALNTIMRKKDLQWGEDIALIISSDAVHYGDEEWGGMNYARYGTDSAGNAQAVSYEKEIIRNCFEGELTEDKIARFYDYTIDQDNFKVYKWTWCGRYSIPVGLLTSLNLQLLQKSSPITGIPVAYATSISQQHLKVSDLRMGETANATNHHWVGYPAIGFK